MLDEGLSQPGERTMTIERRADWGSETTTLIGTRIGPYEITARLGEMGLA